MRSGRAATIVIAAVAVVVALVGLAQLLLPSLAAQRIEDKLARFGHVRSVSVSAWPAIELLWSDADSVRVDASSLALSPAQATGLLAEGSGASSLDVAVDALRLGRLQLAAAALHKRGSHLVATARIGAAQVAAALPPGVRVTLVRSGGGRVVVGVAGGLFGSVGSLRAQALALGGRLLVEPLSPSLAGTRITLFADPRVVVQGVSVERVGVAPAGYALTIRAALR